MGTTDKQPISEEVRPAHRPARVELNGAMRCKSVRNGKTAELVTGERKPLKLGVVSDEVRSGATSSDNALQRTRTFNLLIKSQLLCQLS